MFTKMRFFFLALFLCSSGLRAGDTAKAASGVIPGSFLLTSFDGTNDDLDFNFSNDRVNFWPVSPQALYPGHQRDASVAKVGNHYCIVHTGSGTGEQSNTGFYAACTPDCSTAAACAEGLYNGWSSSLQLVSVSEITGGTCSACQVWAPEFVKNADNTTYVDGSGFPYVSVTISLNSQASFALYTIHFTSLTLGTKDNAVPVSVAGATNGLIDSFILNTGSGFELWYQEWANGSTSSCLQVATSSTLTGGFTTTESGNWAGWGCLSQEGPELFHLTGNNWIVIADLSGGNISAGQINFATSTDNRATWSAFSPFNTPKQAKQGTLIPFP